MSSILAVLGYSSLALGIFFVALEALWWVARTRAVDTTTAVREAERLRESHASGQVTGAAVVAGGSIAGLTTAIICAKFFERVVVVEPDSIDELKRTRVAQYEQVHAIQAVSLLILRGIIPDFDTRISAFGGAILESNAHLQIGSSTIKFAPNSLPSTVFVSRISLEHMLRAYVREIPAIQFLQGSVTQVIPDVTGTHVQRVVVQVKHDSAKTVELDAAMLADCSGPATIGLKLLEKAEGAEWGPYPKISYDPKITYSTAFVPVPDRIKSTLPIFTRKHDNYTTFEELGFVKGLIPDAEQDDRMACMIRADGHILCGIGGWDLAPDMRPRSLEEFIQQMESIWQNASNGAYPEEDPSRMAVMDSIRAVEVALGEDGIVPEFKFCKMGPCYKIDYAKASRPSNFVAIGDSFLRVNPTYGQGISKALVDVASLNGALLDTALAANPAANASGWSLPSGFSSEMLTRQTPRVVHMWDSTKDSDYGRRGTELVPGESPELGEFGRTYWKGVVHVAGKNKYVAADVIKATQLVAPPLDLLRPSLFVRAMWSVWRGT
ncbi:hypothetical protein BDV93DRAFT_603567 [Ceratobasidium sp. AG-I]|nr:hypothetical protein BDV93DRAFT_603567 [Ceratobasidium sp. AG-I]